MKNGIINVYKEKGYTSFDVVAILRKLLQTKKIGHTGTLDPQAEGVLPVCIGKATKAVDFLVDKTKTYATTFKLGVTTDTQDHTGQVIKTHAVECSEEEILKVIKSFIGDYSQMPPMYSALKINGKRLYELAREGKTVERKTRDIIIYDIIDIDIAKDQVFLRVICSKGTYIRTLCHDIGEALGCGAHMTSLIREKTGHFELQNSLKIDEIKQLVEENKIEEMILDIDKIFLDYPQLIVNDAYNKVLYNGNKLKKDYLVSSEALQLEKLYRVYDTQDQFIGIYSYLKKDNEENELKPITLFL